MTSTTRNDRIQFLIERDGLESAIEWVKRTLAIYRESIDDQTRYSSHHKELMDREVQDMQAFLEVST